ncbi:MAG TPA: primosomal protein N', partial [Cellvibrionaceae bacterium]
SLKRAPKQAAVIAALQQYNAISLEQCRELGFSSEVIRQLKNKQLIGECELAAPTPSLEEQLPLLPEQQAALNAISPGEFHSYLLDGATGSGKTEVYLQAINKVFKQNPTAQALVLVPEIGLTPQMLTRFTRRFGNQIVSLHSGLNDRERLDGWLRAKSGEARIIIGTRSAIFTPQANLGIIIVDEEHDGSFKQQDGLRYNARDLAIVRGKNLGIPVLLGSATPALETLNNAEQGRFRHLRLTRSAVSTQQAAVKVIDLNTEQQQQGLTETSLKAIEQHIQAGNQVLVFLNRRGFAPTVQCADCGWIADCPNCDARLTLHHYPAHLHCHHCDFQRAHLKHCAACNSTRLQPLGLGTERSEQQLQQYFSHTPIIRIDRDSTRGKTALSTLLKPVHDGESCILVGTQMLAKGHHFPNVTLVVVVDADSGLFSADFRGAEHMGQLLTQVSGRAGREHKPGEVLLQSRYPDHPYLQTLITRGYHHFAHMLLDERRLGLMPPYSYLVLIRADAPSPTQAQTFLHNARKRAEAIRPDNSIEILGPLPALMEKRGQRYRFQLQLKALTRGDLKAFVTQLVPALEAISSHRSVRWSVDIDPQDMS